MVNFVVLSLMFCFCSCGVGVALPVYSTFKAIESKDQNAQQNCLFYWAGTNLPNRLFSVLISY